MKSFRTEASAFARFAEIFIPQTWRSHSGAGPDSGRAGLEANWKTVYGVAGHAGSTPPNDWSPGTWAPTFPMRRGEVVLLFPD